MFSQANVSTGLDGRSSLDEVGEPSPAELAAIEAEAPLIEAELAVTDAEIRVVSASCPSELDWRRLRRTRRQALRLARAARRNASPSLLPLAGVA